MNEKKFTVKSENYEIMNKEMNDTALYIRSAVINRVPIIIRHHNDPDGICAGIALELSIKKLMNQNYIKTQFNLQRQPCKAPYYDYNDFLKDLSTSKRYEERNDKKPLIIILDNGSSPQDLFAIKCLYSAGINVIVIDHHDPVHIDENNKTLVCPYLKHHINPYIFNIKSPLSAGMIAYEVAELVEKISEEFNSFILPSVSGIDDRCDSEELKQYIQNSDKSEEDLKKIGQVIDYLAFKSRMDLNTSVYLDFIKNNDLLNETFKELEIEKNIALENAKNMITEHKTKENYALYSIDLNSITGRFDYPRSGKIAGMIKDELESENKVVILGFLEETVIVRQSEAFISVKELVLKLSQNFPNANILGGGHDRAGSIKFIKTYKDEIKKFIIDLFQ